MFRHVVMFRWKPGVTADVRTAVTDGLAALPAAIDTIRDYRVGPDAGLAPDNWDYVVVADFLDEAGYLVYRDHPDHRAVVETLIRPAIDARVAVQYVADAPTGP